MLVGKGFTRTSRQNIASAAACRDLWGMRDGAWYGAGYDRPIHKRAQYAYTHAPYHTTPDVALIGRGQGPMPGDVSLAHHGVRFLDERPEFRRHGLEVLRQLL
jgi:hypothetical protein